MSLIRLRRFGEHFVDPRHVIAVERTPYPKRGVRLTLSTGGTLWAPVHTGSGYPSVSEADERVREFLIDLGVPVQEVRGDCDER